MPEFGVMFKFDEDYNHVTWYGIGPEETYIDRWKGAKLGIYKNKIEDNMAKYLVPQECGNKVGGRWASVTDRKGRGMLFTGDNMEFSALTYTPHENEERSGKIHTVTENSWEITIGINEIQAFEIR